MGESDISGGNIDNKLKISLFLLEKYEKREEKQRDYTKINRSVKKLKSAGENTNIGGVD